MTASHPASRADLAVRGVRLPGGGRTPRRGDRGAVLVHVAVAMMGLLAFSAVSIDLGTLWVARAQAQNAADAGALAGAAALAFVNPTDTDAAAAAAAAITQENQVWGQPVSPASLETTSGACPAGSPAMSGACLQVRVSRNSASGTPLPVFFSRLFGVNAAEVTALASAKVMLGNATSCLRPWAIPDRWREAGGGLSTPMDTYDAYQPGTSTPLPNPDTYVAPGYDTSLIGTTLVLERGDLEHPGVTGNLFYGLDMPVPGMTAREQYEENIQRCNGTTVRVGDQLPLVQVHIDWTQAAVDSLVAQDQDAYWDGTSVHSGFAVSPRIVPMALYDPDALAAQPTLAEGSQVVVRNIVGAFIIDFTGSELRAVVVPTAGRFDNSAPALSESASFLRSIALVR